MVKVLHILDHFFPVSSGYTFRTSYMLESQRKILGVEPVVLTAPQHSIESVRDGDWNGIPIYSTEPPSANGGLPAAIRQVRNMVSLGRRILEVAAKEKVQLLHAHSPVLNAWPALWAGRKLGLPVAYEIRAFWEDAAVLHGSTRQDSLRYRITRMIETQACRRADAVVTICEGLRNQLLLRGIPQGKIFILPNGVDTRKFSPGMGSDNGAVRAELGLDGKLAVGFVGSLYRYEGLPLLVEALARLAPRYPDLRAVIVGEGFGAESRELKETAARLGVADRLIMPGRVPHEKVGAYYQALDVLVYPRVRSRLLELVTPLKILEAMALGKAVVGSDVGGIREIIRDRENGLLFKADDASDLARTLASLLDHRAEIDVLGTRGRRYVEEHRKWDTLIEAHRDAYRKLGVAV